MDLVEILRVSYWIPITVVQWIFMLMQYYCDFRKPPIFIVKFVHDCLFLIVLFHIVLCITPAPIGDSRAYSSIAAAAFMLMAMLTMCAFIQITFHCTTTAYKCAFKPSPRKFAVLTMIWQVLNISSHIGLSIWAIIVDRGLPLHMILFFYGTFAVYALLYGSTPHLYKLKRIVHTFQQEEVRAKKLTDAELQVSRMFYASIITSVAVLCISVSYLALYLQRSSLLSKMIFCEFTPYHFVILDAATIQISYWTLMLYSWTSISDACSSRKRHIPRAIRRDHIIKHRAASLNAKRTGSHIVSSTYSSTDLTPSTVTKFFSSGDGGGARLISRSSIDGIHVASQTQSTPQSTPQSTLQNTADGTVGGTIGAMHETNKSATDSQNQYQRLV